MRVSIITAVRNNARTIAATLQSVAVQRYPLIDHVVIDGGSTDGTVDLISQNGSRVKICISEADNGVYDAFNKGVEHASGDLIGFLNSGDRYVDENAIDRLVDHAEQTGADAVFGDVAIIDPNSHAVVRQYRSKIFSPRMIAWGFMPAHPTLFVRRTVFERFGVFDSSYRIAGDFEFVARAFGKGAISYAYLPETLVQMEYGGLSNRGWESKWTITKEMRRACLSNGLPSSWIRLLLRLPFKYISEQALLKAESAK